jgi:hypothetical protein
MGSDSCYALREGFYVPSKLVDLRTASSVAYLIQRDLKRGFSYDRFCNKIIFTPREARRRLRRLISLAKKHFGPEEARKVRSLVKKVLMGYEIPMDQVVLEYVDNRVPVPVGVYA